MNNENLTMNKPDPTLNVKEMIDDAVERIDDLRKSESKRMDDKFADIDVKYQIQFTSAKEAVGIASAAQEKLVAQALEGTKEAITKNDANTDKRFDLLSEKIDAVMETISKSSGAQGIYVTHSDLAVVVDKIQTGFKTSMESFETSLKPIFAFMNAQAGQEKGIDASWTKLVTIIGITATVITLLIKFV